MVGLLLPWVALEDAVVLTALDRSITWLSVVLIGANGIRLAGGGEERAVLALPSWNLIHSLRSATENLPDERRQVSTVHPVRMPFHQTAMRMARV